MRFHWQNLNDPDREGRKRYWLNGRAWLFGWCLEWCFPSWRPSFALAFLGPRFVGGHACGGPVGLFLSRSGEDRGDTRRVEFYWTDGGVMGGAFHLALWSRAMDWRSADPWWVKGIRFSPSDLLLGQARHEHILHEQDWTDALVPMPEGCYPARLRREERRWTRPRWPWWPLRVVQRYVEIELPGGIPFEGKGENSWDCGEDGLWGCSSSGWSYERAIGHVVESVLNNRKRYGGSWVHRGRPPILAPSRAEAR